MNKEEIITLSSDEESEHINQSQTIVKINPKALQLITNGIGKKGKTGLFSRYCVRVNKYLNNSPQTSKNDAVRPNERVFAKEKNDIIPNENSKASSDFKSESEVSELQNQSQDITGNSFYDNFVQKCISLEPEPNDKVRLQKKLIKRYREANPEYATSDEFKEIIDKCIIKLNSKNIYFFAKEVADELCSRKKIVSILQNNNNQKISNNIYNETEENELDSSKFKYKNKKQKRLIEKILKQLNMLGSKIRELEVAEVDLSDEEESSYVQLQRYRYRFCLVYKQLCKLTREVSDANRVFSRRICFSGSKYPEINKSIENWLNETKRFPDFKDVFTLLESQSSTLGLPSDQESLRAIATDIFQKVGVMLQRRRKFDLWDSFCSYLDEHEDPASKDPELENTLKKNYETRVTKEKEIIAHFAKLQDRERIKPVEVSDKEALESPSESGTEEEREIEAIEESINKKLDIFIDKVGEHISNDTMECDKKFDYIEIDDSDCITEEAVSTDDSKVSKESKNNYINCKSLKWRTENPAKCSIEKMEANTSVILSDHSYGNKTNVIDEKETIENSKGEKECEVKNTKTTTVAQDFNSGGLITKNNATSILVKRLPNPLNSTNAELCLPSAKKSKLMDCQNRETSTAQEAKKCGKSDCSFEVRYCHVEYNFRNFCKVNYERNLSGENKRNKIVKDLTNIRKILDCKRVKKISSRFDLQHQWNVNGLKKTWEKRYAYAYCSGTRSKGKKCAVNQEEKTAKNMNNVKRDSNDKNDSNDSQGQGNETCGFGSGSGNERDNNENDENKKNGKKAENDSGECRNEEEEDDKEEENETEKNGEENLKVESVESISPSKISPVKTAPSSREGNSQSKSPSGRGRRKRQARSKNIPEPPKPSRINRRGHWKRRTSLVTAETAVGGDVVKAVVTLNENSEFFSSDGERGRFHYKDFPKFDPSPPYEFCNVEVIERNTCLQEKKKKNQDTKPSDEERVKQFLLNSPSSISITPPRRLSSKPPSQEVLQALATLKKLKGISTTRVIRKPDVEDDVVVIAESKTPEKGDSSKAKNRRKSETSVLPNKSLPTTTSKVETVVSAVPKIVGVQGNVTGFEFKAPKKRGEVRGGSEPSTLRISNVWGNCNSFEGNNESEPSCSYAQANGKMSSSPKGKKSKKSVEYVVLD